MLTEAEPELQLVVDCVRTAIVTDASPELPALDDTPDWDRVVELARYHGVVQLLYQGWNRWHARAVLRSPCQSPC